MVRFAKWLRLRVRCASEAVIDHRSVVAGMTREMNRRGAITKHLKRGMKLVQVILESCARRHVNGHGKRSDGEEMD